MGSTGLAGIAREIDIGAPTLKSFLEGGRVYTRALRQIEAYLAR